MYHDWIICRRPWFDCFWIRQLNNILSICSEVINETDALFTLLLACFMGLFLIHPLVYRSEEILIHVRGLNDDIQEIREFRKLDIASQESRMKTSDDKYRNIFQQFKELQTVSREQFTRLLELEQSKHKLMDLIEMSSDRLTLIESALETSDDRNENILHQIKDLKKHYKEHTTSLIEVKESQTVLRGLLNTVRENMKSIESGLTNSNIKDDILRKEITEIDKFIQKQDVRLWKLEESLKNFEKLSERDTNFYKDKTALLEKGLKHSVETIMIGQQNLWDAIKSMQEYFSEKLKSSKDSYVVNMMKSALSALSDFALNYFLGPLFGLLESSRKKAIHYEG